MKNKLFIIVLSTLFFTGCVTKSLDYFTIYSSPEYDGPNISEPIHIVLDKRVSNKMVWMEKSSTPEFVVNNFRKTFLVNLKRTFLQSFSKVNISDEISEKGLTLSIDKIHANPKIILGKFPPRDVILSEFSFDFTLYQGGKIVKEWNSEIATKPFVEYPGFYRDSIAFGVKFMCENISESVLSDSVRSQYLVLKNG